MSILWIFDFDGTLVDSENAIKKAYIETANQLIPEKKEFIKEMLIGPSLEITLKIILKENYESLKSSFKKKFQEIYDKKMLYETKVFDGVESTLIKLKKSNNELAILTNKRSIPTRKLVEYFGWSDLFSWISCIDEFPELEHKYQVLKTIKIQRKKYDNVYLIGDTTSDGMAANINGFDFIKANYGYGRKEDWRSIKIYKQINSFKELLLTR